MAAAHPLVRLESLALVALGGFAGATLRLLAVASLSDVAGVVLANAVGSLVLGVLVYEAEYTGLVGRRLRLVVATGFLSSLTTYSTFAIHVALAGTPLAMFAVIGANYGIGIAGVLLGREAARRFGTSATATGVEP